MAIVTRHAGTCPICTGVFKVQGRALVLHGYKRPGAGYIIGNCFAVGRPPYELSADVCREWRERLQMIVDTMQTITKSLEARMPTELSETAGRMRPEHYIYHRDSAALSPNKMRYAGEPFNATENDDYERVRKNRIAELRHHLSMMKSDSERMTKLIAAWKPAPLMEIDEEGRTSETKAAQAARKNEREQARLAKEAKRKALDEKQLARHNAMWTEIDAWIRMVKTLARQPKSADRDLQAMRLNRMAMTGKWKMGSMFWEMGRARAEELKPLARDLIALGIGESTPYGAGVAQRRAFTAPGKPVIPGAGNEPAAKHERGENPRVSHNLKLRMDAVLGRSGRRRF